MLFALFFVMNPVPGLVEFEKNVSWINASKKCEQSVLNDANVPNR